MPMLTTARIRSPVCPVHSPPRTRSAKSAIRSSTSWTSCRTSWPSTSRPPRARVAQGDVQHGAVLGDVDVLAAEHRLGALAEPGALGQRHEQPDRLAGQPVLRVVQVQVAGAAGQLLAAARVLGEQVPQVDGRPPARWCSASACHSALSLIPTAIPPGRRRPLHPLAGRDPGRPRLRTERPAPPRWSPSSPRSGGGRRADRRCQLLPVAPPAAGGDDHRVRRSAGSAACSTPGSRVLERRRRGRPGRTRRARRGQQQAVEAGERRGRRDLVRRRPQRLGGGGPVAQPLGDREEVALAVGRAAAATAATAG